MEKRAVLSAMLLPLLLNAVEIQENSRVSFETDIPAGGRAELRTNRGNEKFTITFNNGIYYWHIVEPGGKNPVSPATFFNSKVIHPYGTFRQTFAVPEHLMLEFLTAMAAKKAALPANPIIAMERVNGMVRLYFNRMLLHEYPDTGDLKDCNVQTFKGSKVVKVDTEKVSLTPGTFKVDLREAALPLSRSKFLEGQLEGNEQSNHGSFGGRWSGALYGNPLRLQYRIPMRKYGKAILTVSCEKQENFSNSISLQFYRQGAGFPKNYQATVPADGKKHTVEIPLNPDDFQEFTDLTVMEVELSGAVQVYRAFPDPLHYSMHTGGKPSAVKVHSFTLCEAEVETDIVPEAVGHVWQGGAVPGYKLNIKNNTGAARTVEVSALVTSYDQKKKSSAVRKITLAPRTAQTIRFEFPDCKFGWSSVRFTIDGINHDRALVRLRSRERKARDFDAPGFKFGHWDWNGGHRTAPTDVSLQLMGMLGMESSVFTHMMRYPDIMRKYGMVNYRTMNRTLRGNPRNLKTTVETDLLKGLIGNAQNHRPTYELLFAEPSGFDHHGTRPEFYGEAKFTISEAGRKNYEMYKKELIAASAAMRKHLPGKLLLMPWGDPAFAIPFLEDPETRKLFDGVGFDSGNFDRMPEQQFHQCSIHRMLMFKKYWEKFRPGEECKIITTEGPCMAPVAVGALTESQYAAYLLRGVLTLAAYGVKNHLAMTGISDCGDYWGEQHYGCGLFNRIGLFTPHVAYAACGTIIRHLRHMEFVRVVDTGSLSVFCYEFKDVRNGKKLHVMWTLRGKRPVKIKCQMAFDMMDNITPPVLSPEPIFVYGWNGKMTLGTPDHSDNKLEADHLLLGEAKELFVRQVNDFDKEYLESFPLAIRRFPAEMKLEKTADGLAVTLPKQPKSRGVMPFTTALVPAKPIVIPGKGKYISLEVTANSDWGRVVYCLRDAKGEKIISVGQAGQWNCDDTPGHSVFCFDGKRLLKFELPATLADGFRDMGNTWWGFYGGDKMVDYPLTLEKIYIERREDAVYGNSLVKCSTAPVVLGKLYVEYESKADMTTVPVRQQQKKAEGKAFNPIAEFAAKGKMPATELIRLEEPQQYCDGTRAMFHFKMVPEAVSYDIFVSRYADGTGALRLGKNLKTSGMMVTGFKPDTDFYAFVVYYDKTGNASKPSKPLHFNLQDKFGNK